MEILRDYSRKFWAAIPYMWERVANATRVHKKLWAPC